MHIENNGERLPEKPQGSMNWPLLIVLNITNNNAKKIKKIMILQKI